MLEQSKTLISGLKYSAIAAKTAGIAFFNKEASQKYLLETLSSIPGISAKAAQLLSMKFQPNYETQINPMPLELVKSIIENESPKLAQKISIIEEQPFIASLGQVHKAQLDDGAVVAIKVQYPDVAQELKHQFNLLRQGGKFGPPKKYKLAIDELSTYFQNSVMEEVDYLIEAQKQMEFYSKVPSSLPICIPEVHIELSTSKVLVQDFENSMTLEKIKVFWPQEAKQDCARLFVDYFLKCLFESFHLHSDPHPRNYGFRPCHGRGRYNHELVLYDFGSTLRLQVGQAATIHQLITKYIQGEDFKPLDYLVHLGFDQEKLSYIEPKLPALTDKLLYPFSCEGAYRISDWHIKEHFNSILGDDKWWFRTSGPPWFLMFMRAMQGILFFMNELNQTVPFKKMFLSCQAPRFEAIPAVSNTSHSIDCLSKQLRVLVLEQGCEKVKMDMPARAVDDLENLISEETLEKIRDQGLNILELKAKVQKSGYIPQLIFHAESGQRSYKVWLD